MGHLDPKWLGFVIYLGLRMHQFQKYHPLKDLHLALLCAIPRSDDDGRVGCAVAAVVTANVNSL